MLCICIVSFFITNCKNDNQVIDPSTLCHCDASIEGHCFEVTQTWSNVVNNLMEVYGRDFKRGEWVGTDCQGETGVAWDWPPFYFNSWQPVDGFKTNMSAVLHEFNWNIGDDDDWNMHLVPTPPFAHLITDVEALHDESIDNHNCGGQHCMEGEISPDKKFWNNPWFFQPGKDSRDAGRNGYSWLEGRQMGFYGLWIMDANHDYKSEIHPANMMWFKDHFEGGFGSSKPFDIFWLMLMQDNTGRFDDRDNFDCDGDAPAGWKPWEDSPKSGEFNIAFLVNPSTEVVSFSINELFKRFVVTSQDDEAKKDADDGTSHALEINGKVVVKVDETQPNDDDLGVTFSNLCMRPDGKLQGFVTIRSMVGGNDDKDEEGFHILYLTRTISSTRPVIHPPKLEALPRLMVTQQEVPGSVKNNGKKLVADLKLILTGSDSATADDYTLSKVQYSNAGVQTPISFEQGRGAKEVLLKNIPIKRGGAIVVTTASGLTSDLPSPYIEASSVIADTVTRQGNGQDAYAGISQLLLGKVTSASGRQLAFSSEMTIKLIPHFTLYLNGDPMDRNSVIAGEVNQALREHNPEKLKQVFNNDQPVNTHWVFIATNLSNGKQLPVYTAATNATEGVLIEYTGNSSDSLHVKFLSPSSAGIIELSAKAVVADALGNMQQIEKKVWSHYFSVTRNISEAADLVKDLLGVTDRRVLLPPKPDKKTNAFLMQEKMRHSYVLNAYMKAMCRDGKITIDELRRMMGALKNFGFI